MSTTRPLTTRKAPAALDAARGRERPASHLLLVRLGPLRRPVSYLRRGGGGLGSGLAGLGLPRDTAAARVVARVHPDDRHHAVVLVAEDVAVIDEVADVRAAEVHAHLDARERARARPVRDLEHVEVLAVRDRHAVLLELQEVDLGPVELVVLAGPV